MFLISTFIVQAIIMFLFSFLSLLFISIWIYKDCKLRGDSPLLWILLLFFTQSFLVIIFYIIFRKTEKRECESCNALIPIYSKYCNNCGAVVVTNDINNNLLKIRKNNARKYLTLSIICFVISIFTFIFSIGIGLVGFFSENITTNVKEYGDFVNKGFETISSEIKSDNTWSIHLVSATKGYVKERKMYIDNPKEQILQIDTNCNVKNDGNLTLYLVQEDNVKTLDVTNKSDLECSLSEFKEGYIYIRLQINDVKDVKAEITIK